MALTMEAYQAQMRAKLTTMFRMEELGALRIKWKAMIGNEALPTKSAKEAIIKRLVDYMMAPDTVLQAAPPKVRRNLIDNFDPELESPFSYNSRVGDEETLLSHLIDECMATIDRHGASLFCVGKSSSTDTKKPAYSALYSRWKDRYSKEDAKYPTRKYQTMVLLYRDTDVSNPLLRKTREDRVLWLEKSLHAALGEDERADRMDDRYSDFSGNLSKADNAFFYLYIAVGTR